MAVSEHSWPKTRKILQQKPYGTDSNGFVHVITDAYNCT